MTVAPIWITEQSVTDLLDLAGAIDALGEGMRSQAAGAADPMSKAHLGWDGGGLHAIGAALHDSDLVGCKSWVHTDAGATPLLIIWRRETGALLAVIEAFALGQMRTGAVSGLATRVMSRKDAGVMAIVGAGKQALAQVAAVAAVRTLREVRVFTRSPERREAFCERLAGKLPLHIVAAQSVAEALAGAEIVTLVTRASQAFVGAEHLGQGVHINAVGAIAPDREEFRQNLFDRAGWLGTDDSGALFRLSREFQTRFGSAPEGHPVELLSAMIGREATRPDDCDLSIFKAMGSGLSDLALGARVLRLARKTGAGREFSTPERAEARLFTPSIQQAF